MNKTISYSSKQIRKKEMKKFITTALFSAFLISGCVVHARPTPTPHQTHNRLSADFGESSHHHLVQIKVKAWVWSPGHFRSNGVWIRGGWYTDNVPRYLLNRQPHTHIRWVKGRHRPTRPQHRHRRPRRPARR